MKGNINNRQNCIKRLKSTANTDLYRRIKQYGNKKLGHLWDFNDEEVLKVMTALQIFCIDCGEDIEEGKDFMLRKLEWQDGEGRIRITTWST